MIDQSNNFANIINSSLLSIKKLSLLFIVKIKKEYADLYFLIPLLNYIDTYPVIMIIFFLFICFSFSNLILNLFFLLLLIDCIFLSLFVLQNISLKIHSTRLSFNILALLILFFNPFNFIITVGLFFFIYIKYNKIISKIILNIIETTLILLFNKIPFLNTIYPNYKLESNNSNIN